MRMNPFRRRLAGVVLLASSIGPAALAQTGREKQTVPTPVFDVITIKPSDVANDNIHIRWNEATFNATNIPVDVLLSEAFGIREDLISGMPSWAKSAHYDIMAKATDVDESVLKQLTRQQRADMMKQVVEERFHVKAHTEVKQLPVYDLLVMKGGIKFKESAAKSGAEGCKGWTSSSGTNLKMECVQIEGLTRYLSSYLQRTVIDKTGLPTTNGYDASFKWRRDSDAAPSDTDLQLPTIYAALQEQLGLKLENSKGPVETLVIDQLDKPTEN